MSRSNNPSYGSDTNEWQPGYSLAYETAERQSRGFPVVPFPESSWTEPSVISHHGPAHHQDPFNDSVGFQLLPNQQQMPASITPSARAVTSPELSSLSPRTLTSVGTIQPARAITSSSHVSTQTIDENSLFIVFQTELLKQYSHQQQLLFFRQALSLPSVGLTGPFVPQQMYKPHTNSDRKRYVEEIVLDAPIYFWMSDPEECGIPLTDALHSRVKRLQNRNCSVFEGRGPSVSIRLEVSFYSCIETSQCWSLQWPGYRQWSRQIPTKDFRSPPAPITLAKLAKNIAKCVQRFIEVCVLPQLIDQTEAERHIISGAPTFAARRYYRFALASRIKRQGVDYTGRHCSRQHTSRITGQLAASPKVETPIRSARSWLNPI